ncbi:MAG: NADH:ubiquinone oxidoreductase [Candidatus Riflebacteria bacterium]|nr:NADH:ubiquinone oxidoreductase [Candidatus Riflebacteria bacterium]
MGKSLYWLTAGGCGGDTMSLLNMESPDTLEFFDYLQLELLWHPSLSTYKFSEYNSINEQILSDKVRLDILCVEGSVIRGPGGTGMFQAFDGTPKKDLIAGLAQKAEVVIAVGTCASFGGIGSDGEIEATGLMFHKEKKGGFLGENFKARGGLPVINISGCPCHCEAVRGTLSALVENVPLELDEFNRPVEWYGMLVHQGCTRNEYHEYRIEEKDFGEKGCLFFFKGCYGPLVFGPCNKILWNRRSSKTRVGVPCFGCTSPDFPRKYPFFETPNIEGLPILLPKGLDRAHYMAFKSIAAASAPDRLIKRITKI